MNIKPINRRGGTVADGRGHLATPMPPLPPPSLSPPPRRMHRMRSQLEARSQRRCVGTAREGEGIHDDDSAASAHYSSGPERVKERREERAGGESNPGTRSKREGGVGRGGREGAGAVGEGQTKGVSRGRRAYRGNNLMFAPRSFARVSRSYAEGSRLATRETGERVSRTRRSICI